MCSLCGISVTVSPSSQSDICGSCDVTQAVQNDAVGGFTYLRMHVLAFSLPGCDWGDSSWVGIHNSRENVVVRTYWSHDLCILYGFGY